MNSSGEKKKEREREKKGKRIGEPWPREERRKRDSRAAVRAGVAAGTVTYYVNIMHLLRYIAAAYAVHLQRSNRNPLDLIARASERKSRSRRTRIFLSFDYGAKRRSISLHRNIIGQIITQLCFIIILY